MRKQNFDKYSQSTTDILLLPISDNRWPPHWALIFSFDLDLLVVIRSDSASDHQNFIWIGPSAAGLWRRSYYQNSRKPRFICSRATVDQQRSVTDGSGFALKFRLDLSYSFGHNASSIFWSFVSKLPTYAYVNEGFGGIFAPNDVIYRLSSKKVHPCMETRRLSHKAWKLVQRCKMRE